MENILKTSPKPKSVTLGSMIEFWSNRGSFNLELYRRISLIKTTV